MHPELYTTITGEQIMGSKIELYPDQFSQLESRQPEQARYDILMQRLIRDNEYLKRDNKLLRESHHSANAIIRGAR